MSNHPSNDPKTSPPMSEEADIGSGEKSPGQHETEEMIRQIPPLPADGKAATPPSTQASQDIQAPPDQPAITSPS